jgi:hypothetical protein
MRGSCPKCRNLSGAGYPLFERPGHYPYPFQSGRPGRWVRHQISCVHFWTGLGTAGRVGVPHRARRRHERGRYGAALWSSRRVIPVHASPVPLCYQDGHSDFYEPGRHSHDRRVPARRASRADCSAGICRRCCRLRGGGCSCLHVMGRAAGFHKNSPKRP